MNFDIVLENIKLKLKEIKKLNDFNNLTKDNSKRTRKLGDEIEKKLINIVNDDLGIIKYKLWLDSEDLDLKWNAAFNLIPLYPTKCLKALIECEEKSVSDSLEKLSMNNVINAYKCGISSNNIFTQRLKKIYKVNDLNKLNREKSIVKYEKEKL